MGATADLLISIKADMASASKQLATLEKELTGINAATKGMGTGSAGLARTEAGLIGVGKAATGASGGFASMMKSGAGIALGMAGIGTAAMATAAVVGGISGTVGAAADFQAEMSNIKAVSGATASEMDAVRASALALGPAWGMGATAVGQGVEELVKAGLSVKDITGGAAEGALTLARAGGIDMATASTVAANAINLFNMRGTDMAHVANMAAGAANATVISVQDYAMAFQQASAAAVMANQSFDQTTVAIAMMGQAGIKNSDAGTSLKQLFLSLAPTTKAARDEMEKLGLIVGGQNQFFDAATGKAKSYRDIAELLRASISGLTDEEITKSFQIIFGSDAYRAAAVAARAGGEGVDAMMASIQKVSAVDVATEKMNNFKGSVDRLGASMEAWQIRTGGGALPGAKGIVDFLTGILNRMNQVDAVYERYKSQQGMGYWETQRAAAVVDTGMGPSGGGTADLGVIPSLWMRITGAKQDTTAATRTLTTAEIDANIQIQDSARAMWAAEEAGYAAERGYRAAASGADVAATAANNVAKILGDSQKNAQNEIYSIREEERWRRSQEVAKDANNTMKQANAEYVADLKRQKDEQKRLEEQAARDAVQSVKDAINQAKQALQDFARMPLMGETAMSDQIFGLDMAITEKERQLLMLQGTRGAGRQVTQITKDLDDLRRQRDILTKEQTLTYEPQHRYLGRLANPATEMTADEAAAGIMEQWGKLGTLSTQTDESISVGSITFQLNGVTGDNIQEKARSAADELLSIIRNARAGGPGSRYQGAANPQLSGGG